MKTTICSWPPENPASTLQVGDVFTLAGHFRRRGDLLSRLLAVFGWIRYTNQLQHFRVVNSSEAYIEYQDIE